MTLTVARTTPYAWPWDGTLAPRRTALLAIAPSSAFPASLGADEAAA